MTLRRWITCIKFVADLSLFMAAVLIGYCVWLGAQPVTIVYVR